MEDIPSKSTGDSLTASEFNSILNELKNAILNATQILNAGDVNQLSRASSNYTASTDFFTDSGVADAYILSPVSLNKAPTFLSDGARVRFIPTNTNTGPSTVNVASLGAKAIKKYGGGIDVEAGDLPQGQDTIMTFRLSADEFELASIEDEIVTESIPLFNSFSGMKLSNNGAAPTTDIDVAPGTFKDRDTFKAFTLTSTLVKELDQVWAQGTNLGGRASAVAYAINTWYHVFMIAKSDGTVDMGFDTDINATNLLADTSGAGFTFFRRRGSVLTDGVSAILLFHNFNDIFVWDAPVKQVLTAPPLHPAFGSFVIACPPDVFTEISAVFEISGPVTNDSLILRSTFQTSTIGMGEVIWATDGGGAPHTITDGRGFASMIADQSSTVQLARGSSVAASEYALRMNQWVELDL